jgi:hypothetical protein
MPVYRVVLAVICFVLGAALSVFGVVVLRETGRATILCGALPMLIAGLFVTFQTRRA